MATQHSFSPTSSSSRYSSASSKTSSSSHANTGGTTSGTTYPRKLTLVANVSQRAPSPSSSPRTPPSYKPPIFGSTRTPKPNLPRQLTLIPREDHADSMRYRTYLPVPSSPTLIESPHSPQYTPPPSKLALSTNSSSSSGLSSFTPSSFLSLSHGKTESTKSVKSTSVKKPILARRLGAGIRPLGPSFLVGLATLLSLFFIISVSMVFVGAADEEDPFKDLLDNAAKSNPGILLLGENVDVDVDEPAITIRWSLVGCGPGFVLAGSEGIHGSMECGTPNTSLNIFVDNGNDAVFTYDTLQFPYLNGTGQLRSIQSLFQFDSDHVLDVHQQRLYPFDTYRLGTTLYAQLEHDDSQDVIITRLATIRMTSSFVISSSDVSGYVETGDDSDSQSPRRELDLRISRPGGARAFALFMFAVNWMLAHATIGFLLLALHAEHSRRVPLLLGMNFVILLAIPQIRNSMPDAPGYDGVLIDSVGFFPQMIIAGGSAICLTFIVTVGELSAPSSAGSRAGTSIAVPATPFTTRSARGPHRRGGSSIDISRLRAFTFGQMSTIREKNEDKLDFNDVEKQADSLSGSEGARGHRRMPGQSARDSAQRVHVSSYRRPFSELSPRNNRTLISTGRTFI